VTSFFVYREIKKSLSGNLANRNHGKKMELNYKNMVKKCLGKFSTEQQNGVSNKRSN